MTTTMMMMMLTMLTMTMTTVIMMMMKMTMIMILMVIMSMLELTHSRTVETTGLNMTGLLPWTEYSVSLTVLTTGLTLPGGTSLPVTVRTRSGRPASPPTRLSLGEVTNTTAYLAWDKPSLPNGPITSYRVSTVLLLATKNSLVEFILFLREGIKNISSVT